MRAYALVLGLLLGNTAFAEPVPSKALNCGDPDTLPYTGQIYGLTVSSYNTAGGGGGYIEITGKGDLKFLMSLYTGTADNNGPAFIAFYNLAELAYVNGYTVTIDNAEEGIYRGCTISIVKAKQL